MSDDSAAIRLSGVCLVRGETRILSDIDWVLERGECAAVLGANGSGKTTLMRVLMGFEWPSEGRVEVLGCVYGETDIPRLRKRIALVDPSERFAVDHNLTARLAVLTGYFGTLSLYDEFTDEQSERARHLLDVVGLGDRCEHNFAVLSSGEQRRCLLARALVNIPEILILDEPTAGLDVAAREHLLGTIEQLHGLASGPTVIMVTHHVEEISSVTSQVMLLKGGRIAVIGGADEVITSDNLTDVLGCGVVVEKRSGRYWLEVLPEAWSELVG